MSSPLSMSKSMPGINAAANGAGLAIAADDKHAASVTAYMQKLADAAGVSVPYSKMTKEVIADRLINGGIFLKHAVGSGQPHYRAVWCSPDLQTISWGELDRAKPSGTLKASEVDSVSVGSSSPAFKKDKTKHAVDPSRCFSIIATSRSLDLECASQTDRDLWAFAFTVFARKGAALGGSPAPDWKSLSAATLCAEVDLLLRRLEDSNAHVRKLEIALKTIDSAGTAAAGASAEEKTAHELQYFKSALKQTKAAELALEAQNRELQNDLERARKDLAFYQSVNKSSNPLGLNVSSNQSNGSAAGDSVATDIYRQCLQEIDRLKAELRLARVREVVRSFVPDSHPSAVGTSGAAGSGHASSRPSGLTNVARLGNYISSLHELDVPITLLSAQSPVPDGTRADEVSETDDEDSETEAAVAERNMDPFAVAVKHVSQFLRGGVYMNDTEYDGKSIKPGDAESEAEEAAAIAQRAVEHMREAVRFSSEPALSQEAAHQLVSAALSDMTETRCAGDAYAAAKLMLGHPEMVVILSDPVVSSTLHISVDPLPASANSAVLLPPSASSTQVATKAGGSAGAVSGSASSFSVAGAVPVSGGIQLSTVHYYRICDAQSVFHASTEQGDADKFVMLFCVATLTKRLGYDGKELKPTSVHLEFYRERPQLVVGGDARRKQTANDRNQKMRVLMADPFNRCEKCSRNIKAMHCVQCRQDMCVACSAEVHQGGEFAAHKRVALERKQFFLKSAAIAGSKEQMELKRSEEETAQLRGKNHGPSRTMSRKPVIPPLPLAALVAQEAEELAKQAEKERIAQGGKPPVVHASVTPSGSSELTDSGSALSSPADSPRKPPPIPPPAGVVEGKAAAAKVPTADEQRSLQATRQRELDKVSVAMRRGSAAAQQGSGHDRWYIIDNQWLNQWKTFVAGGLPRPTPISNARLLRKDNTPKPGMQITVDYRALEPPVWQSLYELYGGGPVLVRATPNIYDKSAV